MNNNNQVNWDEIPEDVEAVITYKNDVLTYCKMIDGVLYVQCWRDSMYENSRASLDTLKDRYGDRFHLRPPAITQPAPEPPKSTQVETSEVEDTTPPEFDWSSVDSDVEAVILYKGEVVQHLKIGLSGELLMNIFNGDGWIDCFYSTIEYRELFIKHYGDGTATLLRRPPAITPPSEKVTCKVEFYEGETTEGMISLDEETRLPAVFTTTEFNWDDVDDDVEVVVLYPDNPPDFYQHIGGKLYVQFRRGEQYFRSDYDTVSEMFEDYDEGRVLIRPLPETTTHDEPPSIYLILQEAQQSILKHHGVTGKVNFTVTCSE